MLFKKNQMNKNQMIIIVLFFLGTITFSCSRRKVKPQKSVLASYEIPTRKVPLNCQKTFETLTLLLKSADLKRVSFKNYYIKTHWIDNTFSFFSKERNNILEKSAKFKLYIKGKAPPNNNENCKLTIFKNQKVKQSALSSWTATPSDLILEDQLFSNLMEGRKNQGEYITDENQSESEYKENSSELIAQEENTTIEDVEETEDIEEIEDIESIEDVEPIEKGETSKKEESNKKEVEDDDEESIESIESLEI